MDIETTEVAVDVADLPIAFSERFTRDYANMADRYQQINAARLIEGNLTLDGLLVQWTLETVAQTEPELLIDSLEELEARVYLIRQSVEQQVDELAGDSGLEAGEDDDEDEDDEE